jgi:protein disulfide-isomerase
MLDFSHAVDLVGPVRPGQSLEWLTDVQAAREKAKGENKLVLLYFTGSDWCPWCKRLKSETFDKPEFSDFARANLVLVEADFPRYKAMAQLQQMANPFALRSLLRGRSR